MNNLMKKNPQAISLIILIALFIFISVFGYVTNGQHGIALDTNLHKMNGTVALNAYKTKSFDDHALPPNHANHHGPIYQMFLNTVTDSYETRHYINFTLFLFGLIGFFLLAKEYFNHWWSLLAVSLIGFYPRIFGHGIINSVDIPFLVGCIWIVLLFKYFEKQPSWKYSVLIAMAVGMTSCIRVLGLFFMFYWGFMLYQSKKNLKYLLACGAMVLLVMFGFYPKLWHQPLLGIFQAADVASVSNVGTPWYYDLRWFFYTLPLSIHIGILLNFMDLKFDKKKWGPIIIWLFVPVLMPILLDSYLYNGWRHHFFVYPAMVLLATRGWTLVSEKLKHIWLLPCLLIFIMMVQLISLSPYQHVYFNLLGKSLLNEKDFVMERDYPGTSYLAALEYIAETAQGSVNVVARDHSAALNYLLLNHQQKKKIDLTVISDLPLDFEKNLYSIKKQDASDYFLAVEKKQKINNKKAMQAADYLIVTIKPWEKQLPKNPDHIIYAGNLPILYIKKLHP